MNEEQLAAYDVAVQPLVSRLSELEREMFAIEAKMSNIFQEHARAAAAP